MANINLFVQNEEKKNLEDIDMAEIGISSSCSIINNKSNEEAFKLDTVKNIAVEVTKAIGNKCNRCWKVLPEVKEKDLCIRCNKIINS